MKFALVAIIALCLACMASATFVAPQYDVADDSMSAESWKEYAQTLQNIEQIDGDWPTFNASVRCSWPLYKQCDGRWGSQILGTSGKTICKIGCAMSSVAMYLQSKGKNWTPGSLDKWLTQNGGYQSGSLLIWSRAATLGLVWRGQQRPTQQEVINGLGGCHGIIANVNRGGHWVLLTGYAGNGNFYVNDPGYNRATYSFGEMGAMSVYH